MREYELPPLVRSPGLLLCDDQPGRWMAPAFDGGSCRAISSSFTRRIVSRDKEREREGIFLRTNSPIAGPKETSYIGMMEVRVSRALISLVDIPPLFRTGYSHKTYSYFKRGSSEFLIGA